MLNSWFSFNGQTSSAFDIIVTKNVTRKIPQRDIQVFDIPGKHGDIVTFQDSFQNIEMSYDIMVNCGRSQTTNKSLSEKAADIAAWLHGAGGYADLRDSFRTDGFRRAYFEGPVDIESRLEKYGNATVTFSADPRFFLDSGNEYLTPENSYLTNPTPYPCAPLFKLTAFNEHPETMLNTAGRTEMTGFNPMQTGKYFQNGLSSVTLTSDSITAVSESSAYGGYVALPVKVTPKTTYAYSYTKSMANGEVVLRQYTSTGREIGSDTTLRTSGYFTTASNAVYAVFLFYPHYLGSTGITWTNFQLERGYTAGEFTAAGSRRRESFTVGGYSVYIQDPVGVMYLDSDAMTLTDADGVLQNSRLSLVNEDDENGFPVLLPGRNFVHPSQAAYESVEVKPRWWTL